MAIIETKYAVGDSVYRAATTTETKQHPCPDCKGLREWTATSPAGDEFKFACPRCAGTFNSNDDLSLKFTVSVPRVEKLTIGSVRYDSHGGSRGDKCQASYMCLETGIGSGTIYDETTLFPTEAEAQKAAELLAAKSNAETPHIVERYNKTLSLSDYQLSSAAMRAAKDVARRAGDLLWNLRDLFDAIDEADTKGEIQDAVDEYRARKWDADKEAARAAA